jgi:hypothetical protein
MYNCWSATIKCVSNASLMAAALMSLHQVLYPGQCHYSLTCLYFLQSYGQKPIKNQHTVHIKTGSGAAVSSPLQFSVLSHCISKHTEVSSAFPVCESTQQCFLFSSMIHFWNSFSLYILYLFAVLHSMFCLHLELTTNYLSISVPSPVSASTVTFHMPLQTA